MVRQRGAEGGGMLLGLLVLAVAGRADEAAAVKAIEKLNRNPIETRSFRSAAWGL